MDNIDKELMRQAKDAVDSGKILNPRLDGVFKTIFLKSKSSLRSFLEAAIERKISDVTVIGAESALDIINGKQTRFDINCILDDNTRAEIEIQAFNRTYDYGDRAQVYVSRLLSSALSRGESWHKVPSVYQISLLDFIYETNNESAIDRYVIYNKDSHKFNSVLNSKINMIFVELEKLKTKTEKDIMNLSKLEKWGLFFKIADRSEKQEILNRLKNEEEGIMEASKTLNKISTDLEMQLYQIREEILETDRITSLEDAEQKGRAEGRAEGIIEGETRGMVKGKIETAKILKQNKVSVDIIKKSTGLSEEEIKKL